MTALGCIFIALKYPLLRSYDLHCFDDPIHMSAKNVNKFIRINVLKCDERFVEVNQLHKRLQKNNYE